jgi:hypothetical protein
MNMICICYYHGSDYGDYCVLDVTTCKLVENGARSFETSVNFYKTTRTYISEASNFQTPLYFPNFRLRVDSLAGLILCYEN